MDKDKFDAPLEAIKSVQKELAEQGTMEAVSIGFDRTP